MGRIEDGRPGWLGVALGFDGPVVRRLHRCCSAPCSCAAGSRIDWRESYQITMAGLAATRLFAAAGAGGIALTAWALRRSGMRRRDGGLPDGAFLVLLYTVYMLALVIVGVGLRIGLFPGAAPFAMTIVPGDLRRIAIVIFLPRVVPTTSSAVCGLGERAAAAFARLRPAAGHRAGVDGAGVRDRDRDPARARPWRCSARSPAGASTSRVLWACFHAFGEAPPQGGARAGGTSSGCSPTCCRCRAASAGSTPA